MFGCYLYFGGGNRIKCWIVYFFFVKEDIRVVVLIGFVCVIGIVCKLVVDCVYGNFGWIDFIGFDEMVVDIGERVVSFGGIGDVFD